MSKCILCENIGNNRKFFFKDKPLCDSHYIAYLEFLITDDEKVTTDAIEEAYERLEISLKPEGKSNSKQEEERQQKEKKEKPYNRPFSMGM